MPAPTIFSIFLYKELIYTIRLKDLIKILLVVPFYLFGTQSYEELLKEADTHYQEGLNATSYEKRNQALNRALSLYHTLGETDPRSAALNRALADIYLQLNEFPVAILYYERALMQANEPSSIIPHLNLAQAKLGLPLSKEASFNQFTRFSPLKNIELFLSLIGFTFLLASYSIWMSNPFVRRCALFSALILCGWGSCFVVLFYSTPVEAILIQSSDLYRTPDWNRPYRLTSPLVGGSKVQVLSINNNGDWLKISEGNQIGYIPTNRIRPL